MVTYSRSKSTIGSPPAAGSISPVIRRSFDVSRKIFSCMISWTTISILLSVSSSTRGRAGVELDEPLLDQGRKLESSANFVDDRLFTECVDHDLVVGG